MTDPISELASRLPGPWDVIVGIPRGGLIVAAGLGYALGVSKVGAHSRHYHRGDDGKPVLGSNYAVVRSRPGQRVLLVEDATVTGTLLQAAWSHYANRGARVTTAAIWITKGEAYRPDVWLHEVDQVPPGRALIIPGRAPAASPVAGEETR